MDIVSHTTQGILGGIHIIQYILDNAYNFQDVDQDVLSEFQKVTIVQRNGFGPRVVWIDHFGDIL